MMELRIGSFRRNSIALLIFVIFYIAFGLLLAYYQERVVYQPWPQDFNNCPELKDAERITFEGSRMYFKDNGPRIVVLYHGNAGSACDRAFYASLFANSGYSYLLPEYAGYSNDTVSPSHEAIKKDAQHVIDFLANRGFTSVVVVGESIGTGIASYHVSLQPPSRLILISPFTNLIDVARHRFWFYPVSLFVQNAFDDVQLLSAYRGPVLILHGDKDDLIPAKLGQRLFITLESPDKDFVEVKGAGHNTMFDFPETITTITSFIR